MVLASPHEPGAKNNLETHEARQHMHQPSATRVRGTDSFTNGAESFQASAHAGDGSHI